MYYKKINLKDTKDQAGKLLADYKAPLSFPNLNQYVVHSKKDKFQLVNLEDIMIEGIYQ